MDKVFKVEITNGEPNGYLSATFLDLPASENEYIQAQIQAKVANSEKMETEVLQVYQGPVTADMVEGAPLSDLNTLAAVLSQLDDTQAFALEGMLKIRRKQQASRRSPFRISSTWRTTLTGAWWLPTFGTTWPWDIFSMKQNSCQGAPPSCWM